jgi:hypothetical protein
MARVVPVVNAYKIMVSAKIFDERYRYVCGGIKIS